MCCGSGPRHGGRLHHSTPSHSAPSRQAGCRSLKLSALLAADLSARTLDVGSTPLMTAVKHGHVRVVRLLLKAPGDCQLEAASVGKTPGYTALLLAAEKGHLSIVSMLLQVCTGRAGAGAACAACCCHALLQPQGAAVPSRRLMLQCLALPACGECYLLRDHTQ